MGIVILWYEYLLLAQYVIQIAYFPSGVCNFISCYSGRWPRLLYHSTHLLFLIIFPPVKYWPQFDWLPLSDVYSAIIISPTCSGVSQQQQFIENIT